MKWSHLIGTPYEKMNCWQFVQAYYRLELGLELNHYYDAAPENREDIQNLIYHNKGSFESVASPDVHDLITLKIHGLESHIAVKIDGNRIAHSIKNVGVCIDFFHRWEKVKAGYWRPKLDKI